MLDDPDYQQGYGGLLGPLFYRNPPPNESDLAQQARAAAAAQLARSAGGGNRIYGGGVFQTGSAPFSFAGPVALDFNPTSYGGAQGFAQFGASRPREISEPDVVRSIPADPASPPPRENVTDDGGSLDGTVRHQQMSETSGNSAYQGSILDGQMPGEDAQLFQVTDEKADSGNNSNQQPEATTQEEYEKARDEARFEMTTRNDVTITGVSPSFYQIPGRGAYSVFDSGFIMHAPDGPYVRFPPGSSVEQYLNGTVIIKDPSGRVHTEYRPS